jgi:hypothetical protein
VHGVPLETARLPRGWQERVVKVQNQNTRKFIGWCLEVHDLAASKLVAFRHKDRDFVRTLLQERLVDLECLVSRIHLLPIDDLDRERLVGWIRATGRELLS